jgi:endonuclease-3 related protein
MREFSAHSVFEKLFARWGAQHWWPSQTCMETVVGAILTQNTNWQNVERAIQNLRAADCLRYESLAEIPQEKLAELIRPAGYFNVKAARLKSFLQFLGEQHDGSLERLFALELPELRGQLLSVKGIGPETADCILLYAANKPVFVVDAYTRRFMERHGWCDPKISYDDLAARFTDQLKPDVQQFNEYHALIVRLGKEHCKTKPACAGCPLADLLP